jgi:hypothetical protein
MATYQTSTVRDDLTAAESDGQSLVRQQHAFSNLVNVQTESQTISTQLSTLLSGDLPWSRLLASLQTAAPSNVELTGVSGSLAAKTTGGATSAGTSSSLPTGTAVKSIGTLTVSGSAPNKPTVAAYVDALGKVPGLGSPLLTSANTQNGVVLFSIRLDITDAALGGRYTSKSAK